MYLKICLLGLFFLCRGLTAFAVESSVSNVIAGALQNQETDKVQSVSGLSDWDSLKKAAQFVDQGNLSAVGSLLGKIPDQSELAFFKNVINARLALKNNQVLEAINILTQLPPVPEASASLNQIFYRKLYQQALLIKKEALEKLGRNTDEVKMLLWGLFPDFENPFASNIVPALAKVEVYKQRQHVLYVLKKWDPIIEMIPNIFSLNLSSLSAEDKCQMVYEWAESMRQLKKTDLSLNGFSSVVNENCAGEPLGRALFWKAKIELSLKQKDQAIKTYEAYIKKFPSERYTDDAYYALTDLYAEVGDTAKSSLAMNHLMNLPQGDMKVKILFENGFESFKKNNFAKAIENFDKIVSMGASNDEAHPQALYWKARALDKGKKSGEAKSLYQRLTHDFPFSFYAVMASHRLGSIATSISEKKITASGGGELINIVDDLNRLGRHTEALEVLDYFAQTERSRAQKDLVLMAGKWLESGDYNQAMMVAHKYFDSVPSSAVFDKNNSMIAALFPLAYPKEVAASARASGLPKGVIEGVMREESLFQPAIASHAGALGLMQLMPATASMQASSSGMGDFSTSRLNEPSLNINLGAQFFARMINQFDGQIPLAIMAYNAGPGNVRKWLKVNGHLPLDEFVEEIPFSETRGYIKRVLRSIQVYGLIQDEVKLKKPFVSMILKR